MAGRSSRPPRLPQRLAMYAGTLALLVAGSLVLGLALLGGFGAGRTVALVAVPVVLVAIVVLEVLLRRHLATGHEPLAAPRPRHPYDAR